MTKETRGLVLGQYGQTPAPISAKVREKIAPGEKPITDRPADHIGPELKAARKEAGDFVKSDEDLLSYVLFPQVAQEFLAWRDAGGGNDNEVAAAIAAARAHDRARAAPAAGAATGGHSHDRWKTAGRQRALRG